MAAGKEKDMEALQCKNCGAAINPKSMQCEYCGTQYERKHVDGVVHYIQTCPAKTQVLGSQVIVDDRSLRRMSPEEVADFSTKQMVRSLAEALVPYMMVETTYDPCEMRQIIRGTVRVIEPDFRF